MQLSYGITVCDELKEIKKLVTILLEHKRDDDEIVITFDHKNGSKEVEKYLRKQEEKLSWHTAWPPFERDFSKLKNYTKSMCKGDYIFHLDADEYPHETLMEQLPTILEANEVDLIWIPRVNTVENLTDEWANKWGWRVTEKGWVNYHDYQARVFRITDDIILVRQVHEYISGCKTYAHLPPYEELSLYHPKTLDKQIKQNKFYEGIL